MRRYALLTVMVLLGLAVGIAKADPPGSKAPGSPTAAEGRTMRVVVLDPQGKPLAGANIHSGIWTHEKDAKFNRDFTTDAAGMAQVELPKTFYILRLWATKKSFVSMFANWEQNELASGTGPPAEYTFRLESAVTAGGRVVDEQGKPIAGARVHVRIEGDATPAKSDGRGRYSSTLAYGNDAAVTEADGRWRIDNVPDNLAVKLSFQVFHSDYVSNPFPGQAQQAAGITTVMLRNETASIALKSGVIMRGRVTDPTGAPVKDALVIYGDDPYSFSSGGGPPSDALTDADGRYRLQALAPQTTTLTVVASGWAPQLRRINLQAGSAPEDFRLTSGKIIRLRIVDAEGKPTPNVGVSVRGWKGSRSLHNIRHPTVRDTKIPRTSNSDGIWEWTWAPDNPIKIEIGVRGFAAQEFEIAGGSPERTVVLKAEHRITGRVTDAVTGNPIPFFTIIPVDIFRKDHLQAERNNCVAGKNGRLEFLARRTDIAQRLRIEAVGYRTQDGSEFSVGDDTSLSQDFRLSPSPPITGVVLDASGQPAAMVKVTLATPTEQASFRFDEPNHDTTTDEMGRFAFPDPGESFVVIARTEAGFAHAEFARDHHDAGTLRLQPLASVHGRFSDGGKPVRGASIMLVPVTPWRSDRTYVDTTQEVKSAPDGSFSFARVPAVPCNVRAHIGPWQDDGFRSGPSVPLDLQPGQKVELNLGSVGVSVAGKVKLTGKVPADLDCTYSINFLIRRASGIAPPPAIAKLGFDARSGWRESWVKTEEGRTYLSTLHYWFVKLAPDGSFSISGVPVGDYDLAVSVYSKPSGCLTDPLARKVVRVTVTGEDAARGELKLSEIPAEVVPIPGVGDVPAIAFQRADGRDGTLADFRGKFVVVHFWASWCGPCKHQLPALRQLCEALNDNRSATLSLSLDEDLTGWQSAVKDLKLPWPQGRLAANSDSGVSSVPAYWLLDPAGKIVSKVFDVDELAKALAEHMK